MFLEFERGVSEAKRWFRDSDITVRDWYGRNVGMSRARPANPGTGDQTAARDSMKAAGQAWRDLPEAEQARWNDYARKFGHLIAAQLWKDLAGWEVFLPAWRNRMLLEESGTAPPLDEAPPEAVTAVEEVFTGEDKTYSFRVTHGVAPEGNVLLVRLTPETATVARQPYARTARMIRGHGKESAVALPPDGGVVTFSGAQFGVRPGCSFGVVMRIVRVADGVHSREYFADLIRREGDVDVQVNSKGADHAEVQGEIEQNGSVGTGSVAPVSPLVSRASFIGAAVAHDPIRWYQSSKGGGLVNSPLICASVLALTVMAGVSEARLIAERQDALPPGRHVHPAPARSVVVPHGETVMLTPVYPVHYPKPIYMTPPLYGTYVPAYYQPAAYFEAVPITPVADEQRPGPAAWGPSDLIERQPISSETVRTETTTRRTGTGPGQTFTRDSEVFDK